MPKHKKRSKYKVVSQIVKPASKPSTKGVKLIFNWQSLKNWVNKFKVYWNILLGLLAIISTYATYDYFKTKAIETKRLERTVTPRYGVLVGQNLNPQNGKIVVNVGNNFEDISLAELSSGNYIGLHAMNVGGSDPANLALRYEGNKFYIQSTFTDLDGKIVGQIYDNNWVIFESDKIKYGNDNERLEVVDKDQNVILSLAFKFPDTIRVMGYVVHDGGVFVSNPTGSHHYPLNPSNKESIVAEIKKIPKIFNY